MTIQPTPPLIADFTIVNHGSICILTPQTAEAHEWVAEHLPADAQTWGNGIAIEPRYVPDIVDGFTSDGLYL